MRAEYDLVVLGDSLSGRWAALYAARQYARVAFIQQQTDAFLARSVVFQELANLVTTSITQGLSFPFETVTSLRLWLERCRQAQLKPYDLEHLAYSGVDIFPSPGHFVRSDDRSQSLIFESSGRVLRSRYFLLALESQAIALDSSRSPCSEITSLEDFLSQVEVSDFQDIYIEGRYPWAILLGQILNQLGHSITIFTEDPILSQEEPELAFLLQCQLESEGITLQLGREPIGLTQSMLLFKPQYHVSFDGLSLKNIGLAIEKRPNASSPQLSVNSRLETQNQNLYACGAALGGYSLERIAHDEAAIALNNLLFEANQSISYEQLACQLPCVPGLIRIGLTETQARRQFSAIQVLTRAMETFGDDADPLFCKVIVTSTGQIVGIHLLGGIASDALQVFEKIICEAMHISELAQLSSLPITLQQIFHDFAYRWDHVQAPRQRDRLEKYFRAKRKQFS